MDTTTLVVLIVCFLIIVALAILSNEDKDEE